MTRTLTITVNEWEAVRDGHLWIVRASDIATDPGSVGRAFAAILNKGRGAGLPHLLHPPADLLAAAVPCETCGGERIIFDLRCDNCGGSASLPLEMQCSNHLAKPRPCPDCPSPADHRSGARITLVGECPYCKGNPAKYRDVCGGVVVLGYAYPASEVLPVFDRYGVCDVGLPEEWMPHITIDADFGEVLACTRDPKYRNEWLEVSIDLAHYGDPAGLVGKWALQLAVEP